MESTERKSCCNVEDWSVNRVEIVLNYYMNWKVRFMNKETLGVNLNVETHELEWVKSHIGM